MRQPNWTPLTTIGGFNSGAAPCRALLTGFWHKLFRVCASNDPEPSVNIFSKYNVALNRASKSFQERPVNSCRFLFPPVTVLIYKLREGNNKSCDILIRYFQRPILMCFSVDFPFSGPNNKSYTVTKIYTLHILCTSPVRLYRDIFAETNVYSPMVPISFSDSSVADSTRNSRKYVIFGSSEEWKMAVETLSVVKTL